MKPLLGVSPLGLRHAPDVATGLSAKIACSHHFLGGRDAAQIERDLTAYSPALGLIELDYLDAPQRVVARLLGGYERTARYRPGLGCTLEIGDTRTLENISVEPVLAENAPWPAGEQVTSLDAELQQVLDLQMKEDARSSYETRALLVVRGGEVAGESYAEGSDYYTQHLGWSMAKSVVAILHGLLEQDGKVSSQDRALFQAWSADGRRDITQQQLLSMTSGLQFDEEYVPGSDSTRMLFASESAANVALEFPLAHQPGTFFAYSSGTSNLLAQLYTDRVGGVTAAASYWYERLLRPLAMAHTTLEPDPSGVFVGSSFIYASARDWARLGLLLLNQEEWRGQQLLPAGWVERASTPNQAANDARYGYQLWLNRGGAERRWAALPRDAYAMQGNRQQVVMVIPSLDVVIVRLGWSSDYPMEERFSEILRHL
ncbi:MAG: serine hydrolase [Pseudomonadota bacterium]